MIKKFRIFQACWVTLRGVAGPQPFFGKNLSCLKRQLKLGIFSKLLLYQVAYGLKFFCCSDMLG